MNIMAWDAGAYTDNEFTILFEGRKAFIFHDIVDATLTESEVVSLIAKGHTPLAISELDISQMDKVCKRISIKDLPTRITAAIKKVL